MKTYRLSTPMERAASVVVVAIVLVIAGLLLSSLRGQIGLMIFSGVTVALIAVMLIIYVINAMKGACVIDTSNKIMEVRGLANYTVDLSTATLLQTVPQKSAQTTIRVLIFSDAEGKIVAQVPTMFSFKQGVQAEPMAKEMAKDLGIDFKQNVPEWEYDKEKFKEHEKEMAEQQRREAEARRQKRKQRWLNKKK